LNGRDVIDVLPPKPILDFGCDSIIRWKTDFHVFGEPKKNISEADGIHLTTPSKPRSKKWLRGQDVSFCRQGLENLIVRYGKCLNEFGDCAEK
jgi:hypothetical protein